MTTNDSDTSTSDTVSIPNCSASASDLMTLMTNDCEANDQ